MISKIEQRKFEDDFIELGKTIQSWSDMCDYKEIVDEAKFTTRADIEAHNSLVSLISKYSTCTDILSEEDYPETGRPESYWLLDPIDGTASWYEGYDGYDRYVGDDGDD